MVFQYLKCNTLLQDRGRGLKKTLATCRYDPLHWVCNTGLALRTDPPLETQTADPEIRTRESADDDTDSLIHLLCLPCRVAAERHNKPARTVCGLARTGWDFKAGETAGPSDLCVVCRSLIGTTCQVCGHPLRYKT